MDPMYQAMLAQDPLSAQQQQLSYYQPLPPPQQGGGLGSALGGGMMDLQQMMGMVNRGRDARIQQVHNLSTDGMSAAP